MFENLRLDQTLHKLSEPKLSQLVKPDSLQNPKDDSLALPGRVDDCRSEERLDCHTQTIGQNSHVLPESLHPVNLEQ